MVLATKSSDGNDQHIKIYLLSKLETMGLSIGTAKTLLRVC